MPTYVTLDRTVVQRYRVGAAHGLARRALFGEAVRITDPDHAIRRAALEHVRGLARRYDDLVPRAALLEGFWFGGERWSLGSPQNGIYRPRRFAGPGALTLLTAAHAPVIGLCWQPAAIPAQRSGFTHRSSRKRAKSASLETSGTPCSIARAARAASGIRLPRTP